MFADTPPPVTIHIKVPAAHVVEWKSKKPLRAYQTLRLIFVKVDGEELVFSSRASRDAAFMYGDGLAIRFVSKAERRWSIRASSARTTRARLSVRYVVEKLPSRTR